MPEGGGTHKHSKFPRFFHNDETIRMDRYRYGSTVIKRTASNYL